MPEPTLTEVDEDPSRANLPRPIHHVVTNYGRPLKWLWDHGFRFLFVLDAIGLYLAMVLINLVRFGTDWPTYPLSHYWIGFALATAVHLTVGYFFGLYEREPRLGYRAWLPRVAMASVLAAAFDGLGFVLLDRYFMPRLNLAVFVVVGSLVLAGNRRLSRWLWVRRNGPPRVVLVGPPDDVRSAEAHLHESDGDAVVVASIPTGDDLASVVAESGATDVLLLSPDTLNDVFPEPLTGLEAQGVGVLQRVGAQETLLGLQAVRGVAGMPFVKLRAHALPSHKAHLKRILELILLVLAAPVALVLVGLVALWVRIRAGRPVLFRQQRVGRDGELFEMVKFRTMVRDAEKLSGPQLATRTDPRIVPGLGILRETRLDELPQLWHVVTGQMAIVGPRPERPELTAGLDELVPGYARRHEIAPGLTGLAQVSGRYATDPAYKLGHDLQYLVNWSPVLDLQILLRTAWVVLARRL